MQKIMLQILRFLFAKVLIRTLFTAIARVKHIMRVRKQTHNFGWGFTRESFFFSFPLGLYNVNKRVLAGLWI